MADGDYKMSDRLLRLSTPRRTVRADGGSDIGSHSGGTRPNSPKRVMSQQEIEASTSRMYSMTRRSKELPPIAKSRTLTKDEEAKSTTRLYRDAMNTQQKKRAMSAERVHKTERCATKVVPREEIDEMVSRMHDKTAELHRRKAEILARKYERPDNSLIGAGKRLSKEEQTSVGSRLCTESSHTMRQSKASLFEKYVMSRRVQGSRMSEEECRDNAARLYRNEPRTD